MTLDEAIKHAEEVAEKNQRVVDTHIVFDDVTIEMLDCDDTEVIEEHIANYQRCADEHRQLAEWLKDYKRLLEQQTIAEERYQDLVEYFSDKDVAKCILEDREEFKKWLERIKWHVRKADELARKLEQPTSDDCVCRQAVLDKAWDV